MDRRVCVHIAALAVGDIKTLLGDMGVQLALLVGSVGFWHSRQQHKSLSNF